MLIVSSPVGRNTQASITITTTATINIKFEYMNKDLLIKAESIDVEKILKSKGYAYFDKGNYNVNIVGIRAKERIQDNTFNDVLIIEYPYNGRKVRNVYLITTDPGLYYLKNPIAGNNGCAILVPGQYRGMWKIGLHRNKYAALVQKSPIKIYRDNNKDNVLDFDSKTITEGVYGINLHKAGWDSIQIDNWSAGCQVFKRSSDFNEAMILFSKASTLHGNSFTYTLLEESDVK